MLKLDALSQLRQLKSAIKESRNLMNGTVRGSLHKFGFVTLDSGKDIYLPAEEMEKVLPGDRVEVEQKKDEHNKTVAQIERLIESPTQYFYGKYVIKGTAHFVDPDLPGLTRWIFIPPQKRKNAKINDFVKCRLTQHPFPSGKAQASVIEILGAERDKAIEWTYALRKYDIRTQWSQSVETQVAGLDESSIALKKADREDLTHLPLVTIDAKSTVDLDDALWACKDEDGWQLFVAIADPSALIEPDSAIDQESLLRGTSVYFPAKHVPMLPEKLAGDLCSLVAGKERLAKVIKIQVKANGELGRFTVVDAVIRSREKMSYVDVSALLSSIKAQQEGSAVADIDQLADERRLSLITLREVASALLAWRKECALVHQDRTEFFLEIDEHWKISAIKERQLTVAHSIVEECMVAANRCIAELLATAQVDSVFISHKGVRAERQDGLQAVIKKHVPECANEDLKGLKGFVGLVNSLSRSELLKPFHSLIFRQFEKSRQSLTAAPHFGLGLERYTTFTSPLRKANDFIVHRQVTDIIAGQTPKPVTAEQLDKLALRLQSVNDAVAEVEQWLKCQYLEAHKEVFEGTIMRTFSSGFQVRIDSNGIEGFVSSKELNGKFSFNQELLTLTGKNRSFVLDQKVKVRLKSVDWSRKQIQFELCDEVPVP